MNPQPRTNAAMTILAFQRNKTLEHNAQVCHASNIPERQVVRLLCCFATCYTLFPNVYKSFDTTVQKFRLEALNTTAHTSYFLNRYPFRSTTRFTPCWLHFLFSSAPGGWCPPLGVLLRPDPGSGRLLKRWLYSDDRLHSGVRLYLSGQACTLLGGKTWGSNPNSPKSLRNVSAARWEPLRNVPSKGHHTRYITLFFTVW